MLQPDSSHTVPPATAVHGHPDGGQPAEADWFALFVKPKHEKFVSQLLRQKGLREFLPVYRTRHRWSDRYKMIARPLFPGYTFCRFAPGARLSVLQTPGVARIVGLGRCPAPIDPSEIERLQSVVASGVPARPCEYLQAGRWVRIQDGPLRGVEGILDHHKGGDRLVLSVSLLQRSIAVEVEGSWALPIRRLEGVAS